MAKFAYKVLQMGLLNKLTGVKRPYEGHLWCLSRPGNLVNSPVYKAKAL